MSTAHDFLIPEFQLGDRMALALRNTGHSVQDAADYFGCSRQTIGNWINNRIQPSLGDLRLWAMWTGVPLVWLQTGVAPHPEPSGEADNVTRSFTGCLRIAA